MTKIFYPLLLLCLFFSSIGRTESKISAASFYLTPDVQAKIEVPPFPSDGSAIDKADLEMLHSWQKKRSAAECARAESENLPSFENLFGKLNPFPNPLPSVVLNLLAHVHDDSEMEISLFKKKYQRKRPFIRDLSIKPCITKELSFSYPSGHSTLAHIYAYVLSDLVPERKKEFFFRADELSLDRVIGGVHHPSDVRAGAKLADIIHAAIAKNDRYQVDLQNAREKLSH